MASLNGTKVGAMTQLLAQVQENTKKYLEFFSSQNLPEPSFEDGDGLQPGQPLPEAVEAAKYAAIEAADELHHLLLGPIGTIIDCPGDQYLMLGIQYIYRFKIASLVPLDPPGAEISFDALAASTGQPVKDVTRILRSAIGRHVFREPKKGYIAHTASSRILAYPNPQMEGWVTTIAEQFWPALPRVVDATQKWPGSEEPTESGWSLGHNNFEDGALTAMRKDPDRQARFLEHLGFSHQHQSFSVEHLLRGFDFSTTKTVVDVGGADGLVAIALAQKFPSIEEIVVQDLADVVTALEPRIPAEFKQRIRGVGHDFFVPQPASLKSELQGGADVYLLRWILHDWSDKYCVKILQGLIPGLKKGAKVVVNDICIPEPGQLGVMQDRHFRLMDISMKAFSNARERDAETWISLFVQADARFKFLGITVPQGARMAIIQAEWMGEDQ